ncbi:MAG: hypothetical protein E7171_07515 [Firmicutes bacterium]|nr:hypothetical protein [Bacillota bacterium]
MNIIFLDIDGVLNSHRKLIEVYKKTHKPHSGYNYPFDEICLNNLKELVEKTNSKIVITSSWRKDEEGRNKIIQTLKNYSLDQYIIGYTPILHQKRGIEIKSYLDTLETQPNFIILDDDTDMESLIDYLIKTNIQVGLTKENIEEAIIKLTKKRT